MERGRVRQPASELTKRRAHSVGTLISRSGDCGKLSFLKQLQFWSWKREGTIYLIPLLSSLVCPNFLLPPLPLTRPRWDIARERLTAAWRWPCGHGWAKRRPRCPGLGCCPGLGRSAGSARLFSPLARFSSTGRVFFHSAPDSTGTEPRSLRGPCSGFRSGGETPGRVCSPGPGVPGGTPALGRCARPARPPPVAGPFRGAETRALGSCRSVPHDSGITNSLNAMCHSGNLGACVRAAGPSALAMKAPISRRICSAPFSAPLRAFQPAPLRAMHRPPAPTPTSVSGEI